jgi:restriction system protein
MTMPKYHECFTSVLQVLGDGKPWKRMDCINSTMELLDLTESERQETMSRGGNRAVSRIGWAAAHLYEAGAISHPQRGVWQITELGRRWMERYPDHLPKEVVFDTDGIRAWTERSKTSKEVSIPWARAASPDDSDDTPEEKIEEGIKQLLASLKGEILERLRSESPLFFEQVVLKLLNAMGYGNGEDDVTHLGGSGDEGVDGVINQDKLGLDQIYIQAKRYKEGNTIDRDTIQAFAGAIGGKKANRGVFITTSSYRPSATEYAKNLANPRIILIDGDALAGFMIEQEVGVTAERQYKIYKIDENFFSED